MKDIIKLVIFLLYTVVIFVIESYLILTILAFINILLMILLKIDIKKAVKNLISIAVFIIFATIINLILIDFNYAMLIAYRLLIICNITYVFSKILSPIGLAKVIEKISYPLKIFNVDPKDIGMIVCISIVSIPIIINEIKNIITSLKSKGFDTRIINLFRHANLLFVPLFTLLLKRINEMEDSIKSKGYNS